MNSTEREEPPKGATAGSLLILIVIVTFTSGAVALVGAVLGSLLSRSPGPHRWSASLLAGATVGGMLGVTLGIWLATCLGTIPRARAHIRPALAGGIIGFVLSIPISTYHLHGPLIPIASTFLPGIGAAAGTLIAHRNSARS